MVHVEPRNPGTWNLRNLRNLLNLLNLLNRLVQSKQCLLVGENDRVAAWLDALERRHLADLTFAEVGRALRALSSCYVERRGRIAGGSALDGAGKRAAFALYYGPLHFLLLRHIVDAIGGQLAPDVTILDVGCGTGVAGAAWALGSGAGDADEGRGPQRLGGRGGAWTWHSLGVSGPRPSRRRARGAMASPRLAIVAAFTANELPAEARVTTEGAAGGTGEPGRRRSRRRTGGAGCCTLVERLA